PTRNGWECRCSDSS
ncbi:matrix protein 2, partial [Influenza A virus (A/northern pintail/California/44249-053/2006(H5N2))]